MVDVYIVANPSASAMRVDLEGFLIGTLSTII
jgi:hypothetical protein